jgi:hypothetical protein
MERKKPFKRKFDNKKETKDLEDKVVYTTRQVEPVKLADWQLKLKAIADCMDEEGHFDNEAVEARYQELIKG